MGMRTVFLCLLGLMDLAGSAHADQAGSVWLPTLGMSMPGASTAIAAPAIRPGPPVARLAPPPVYDRPVVQPGLFPTAPAANDPVDQQKRALYQTQLRAHQRDLANRTGPLPRGAGANAFATQQELNRLQLQAPN
ncbi:MAG TPA: hypothetical protein VGV37_17070 [Aliidongia sp.]|uniref:hypothetical protein n=1 Tax=Aliidongia sp. TaxID=1914230 RepID=UPI002DDD4782|nr:hypothetical protein [Aliidongia sp.]HEV2676239.1 hypothetical protein [Aliidongia sp.]